jgi:hypothetical protein
MLIAALLAGCGGDDDDSDLPTLAALGGTAEITPEATPFAISLTLESTAEQTVVVSLTEEVTETPETAPEATTEITGEAAATEEITPTPRPTRTVSPTPANIASLTAAFIEAPVFSTLTPAPGDAGRLQTATPQIAADVIITEAQFLEELRVQIADYPNIESVTVAFEGGELPGVRVRMDAYGGQAITSGEVFVNFQLTGDFVTIAVTAISTGSGQPPQQYVEIATGDLYFAVITAFDAILSQRLGANHNLESITITEDAMLIMLLIPQP